MDLVATDADPIETFQVWFAQAAESGEDEPEAMTLATSTPDGSPTARTVLLKGCDPDGFVFYTNLGSPKASALAANPRAALLFHWKSVSRQVRVEGAVEEVPREEAERYFKSRPRGSQIGAWASRQSEPIGDYSELEEGVERRNQEFAGREVPLPGHWGGFRLRALAIEFWSEGENRLHRRTRFSRDPAGGKWRGAHLYP